MAAKPSRRSHIIAAAYAHTELNIFVALVSILEGGALYTPKAQKAANKIIGICKIEEQRQLRIFDHSVGVAS
jgi:hypothetical protein